MDIFGVAVCAVCAVIIGAVVKKSNREFSLLIGAAACVMILLAALDRLAPLLRQIESFTNAQGVPLQALTAVLKAVGIALAGQLASHICKDAGESALSYAVELSSKAAILAVSLPLFTQVFSFLEELVKL